MALPAAVKPRSCAPWQMRRGRPSSRYLVRLPCFGVPQPTVLTLASVCLLRVRVCVRVCVSRQPRRYFRRSWVKPSARCASCSGGLARRHRLSCFSMRWTPLLAHVLVVATMVSLCAHHATPKLAARSLTCPVRLPPVSTRGVIATLLTEMDGVGSNDGVLVVAATNRRDVIDRALLRCARVTVCIVHPCGLNMHVCVVYVCCQAWSLGVATLRTAPRHAHKS